MDPPLPGEDECLRYRDGNKLNDSADNLRWSTHASVTKTGIAANLKRVYGLVEEGGVERVVEYANVMAAAAAIGVPCKALHDAVSKRRRINGWLCSYLEKLEKGKGV